MTASRLASRLLHPLCLCLALLGAGSGLTGNAEEVAVPTLQHRVTDLTATLSADQNAALEAKLTQFEQQKGSQLAVLIVPTTQPEAIGQYSIRVVEKTKAHGLVFAGVVAGGPCGTKRIGHLTGQHRIGRGQGRTCGAQRGVPGVDVDAGVGVDLRVARAAGMDVFAQPIGQAAQRRYIHSAMRQFQIRNRGLRGLAPVQRIGHAADEQTVFNRVQALRAFRVPVPHVVLAAIAV